MDSMKYKEFSDHLIVDGDWSNNACMGYVIKAMKHLEFKDDDIQTVVDRLKREFDSISVDDAKKVYEISKF